MADDDESTDSHSADSTDSNSADEEERRIIEVLKAGFETEHVLQQRVLAPLDDTERNPDSDK